MLNVRLLLPEEYHRLPFELNPTTSVVVIAEDADGVMKGYWVAQAVIHIEPVHFDNEIRSSMTGARMLATLLAELVARGESTVFAFSPNETIANYLERMTFIKQPWDVYASVLPSHKE